jgi:hypothetical protein
VWFLLLGSVLLIFFVFCVVSFVGVSVTHLFCFLCYVVSFVCLCPVSCVLNVACFSGLSNLDSPFGFLYHLLNCHGLDMVSPKNIVLKLTIIMKTFASYYEPN